MSLVNSAFGRLLALMQRGKVLEDWKFLEDKFIISLDASGFFSSTHIHCGSCCEKVVNKGTDKESVTYHHQMLVGAVVSPDIKQVLPIGFEPIVKADGAQKNDCERTAAKRWLTAFRKVHPQLPTLIVADGLYANGPFLQELKDKRCSYIINAKEADHKALYEYFWAGEGADIGTFEETLQDKRHSYRFMNDVPLNDTHHDLKVNVLYFEEEKTVKKKQHMTRWLWITDLKITRENAKSIMKGGRCRWKIENETFNTLKSQGYHFEHNYGHGRKGSTNTS